MKKLLTLALAAAIMASSQTSYGVRQTTAGTEADGITAEQYTAVRAEVAKKHANLMVEATRTQAINDDMNALSKADALKMLEAGVLSKMGSGIATCTSAVWSGKYSPVNWLVHKPGAAYVRALKAYPKTTIALTVLALGSAWLGCGALYRLPVDSTTVMQTVKTCTATFVDGTTGVVDCATKEGAEVMVNGVKQTVKSIATATVEHPVVKESFRRWMPYWVRWTANHLGGHYAKASQDLIAQQAVTYGTSANAQAAVKTAGTWCFGNAANTVGTYILGRGMVNGICNWWNGAPAVPDVRHA